MRLARRSSALVFEGPGELRRSAMEEEEEPDDEEEALEKMLARRSSSHSWLVRLARR
jgi:hypothetical protein